MRRSRFRLIVLAAVIVLCAGYSALWWVVADKIKSGAASWRDDESAQKVDISWRGLSVGGFPFGWRATFKDFALRDRRHSPALELHAARLVASARPWHITAWRFDLPAGLVADLASAGGRPNVALRARQARGTAMPAPQGGLLLWLALRDIAAFGGAGEIPVKSADTWVALPGQRPKTDRDEDFALAVDLRQLQVPQPPVGFGPTLDELALGLTVKGPLADGKLAPAIAAWRDAGGTIDVNHLHVDWGGLGITASGTVALDEKLQPIAAFSGGFEGFDAVINALVAADWLTEEQAALVEIALNTLARPGPDGKPELRAPFTIQNGRVFVGPARLGRIPRIVWQ
jgi:hypothetical protein